MAGYGTAFGRGMMIGFGAALLYAAARETGVVARKDLPGESPEDDSSRMVDWRIAERVAVRTAGDAPALHPAAAEQLRQQYRALLEEIEGPINRYTGNNLLLRDTRVEVQDRPAWIRANMRQFRSLLEPVEAFYREQARGGLPSIPGLQQAGRGVVGTQMGLLVGYLSRRVLGQYDVNLLGKEPLEAGSLYFVEPNLRHVERTLGVSGPDLRKWVALHEATHAHEFELHPWVREYMNTTLRSYLQLTIDDLRRGGDQQALVALVSRLIGNARRGQNVLMAVLSPHQRELVSRLQALMSLAEGYSNHVMNAVGRELLPNFEALHERIEHRQKRRSPAELLFLRITGLSMKMEQYRLGEKFVDAVVKERGIRFVNRAWESPENLPTEAEIANPGRWIRRLEAAA